VVKSLGLTEKLPLILENLNAVEVGGINHVEVKFLEMI
jgi:hypothetical protein